MAKSIRVWRFEDAPKKYQNLSTHGGNEDWIAFVPEELSEDIIPWMQPQETPGWYWLEEHSVEGGVIRIGAH